MTSELNVDERYSQEVNKITQGIKSLVTNLNEGPSLKRISPFHNEGNFSNSSASRSYSQTNNYNGYNYNNRQNYPTQVNTKRFPQPDLNYPSEPYSPMKKIPTSGTGTTDPRTLHPNDSDESLRRISDLSMSSGTSYSSQSSTDEINGILRQTHIAVYKFNVRHEDEVGLEVGDAVSLYKVLDDTWFEGSNLRTGQTGIFPSRYVSDILQSPRKRDSSSSPISSVSSEASQFYLRFLGSVEVQDFKGNEVLCSAMKEIVKQHQIASISSPPYCTLDITIHGIKITEHQGHPQRSFNGKRPGKTKAGIKFYDKDQQELQETSHFFDLKNVTFCGCHPNNSRYFAFITKHPEDSRFACHVFMSEFSTEPVAFSIGKAFKEFYHEFLDCQGPM